MEDIKNAIQILKKGGIVIYPTDTAYGIGCRIDKIDAIKRLFEIRKRPVTQPLPVLVDSIEMAQKYLSSPIPDNVRRLMETYWPGALTIVYSCKVRYIHSLVRGKGETIGVRMPNHEVPLELIEGIGVPIAGPSANFHGMKTPYTYDQLDSKLKEKADYVIKGSCQIEDVSTVLDCSTAPWKIIRQGAVHVKFL